MLIQIEAHINNLRKIVVTTLDEHHEAHIYFYDWVPTKSSTEAIMDAINDVLKRREVSTDADQ